MKYNPEEFDEILKIFHTESDEIIQGLNDGFLELEKNPENKEPLKKLLQLSHSLKGGARMIGFNSIQDIAHKIEDILSFWQHDNSKINLEFFQIVYDVCDFLTELIHKCVEKKEDIHDEKVTEFLTKLNRFIIHNHMIPVEKAQNEEKTKKSLNNIDINAIILELMFIIERESEDDKSEILDLIDENLSQLSDIYANTDFDNIKTQISELRTILNSDEKDNNDLNFYKQKISELRNNIYNTNKDIEFINPNIKKKEQKSLNNETISKETKLKNEINDKFNYILSNLQQIKYEKHFIKKITETLKEIQDKVHNEKIHHILSKTINILDIFFNKDIIIDNDCYMVILQCIYLAKRIFSGSEEHLSNLSFLVQRLSLVEDMLNTTIKEPKNELSVKQEVNIVSKDSYDNFNKNITPFDLEEIKTLRVDISKLDNLIAQTGELLINGIKNREHINGLSKINEELTKWNSESKKILNYMKYYEKKGFFNSENSDISNIFMKKIQTFFIENVNIITDLNNEFINLYNVIFEDDNKLNQTVLEIETIAKGIRVLPLATIFHSFPRMVRDIAKENNKKINFYITGSDTTVDKKIIEEIKMPLIHILRNSISHGIELPEERIRKNKNETGVIRLNAKQAENNVIITIEDDGYGINIEKIKEVAIKNGILIEEEVKNMTDEQLMKLIFLPGFSTRESISDISGRGVGLDVVKTKIANLNGDITVDSILNKGCRVTIKVPLSMSTLKTFILLVNQQKYALPINSIKFVKQIKREEIFTKDGHNCIIFDEHSIPVYKISDIFEDKKTKIEDEILTVIILQNQGVQTAFIIDKLLGAQEVFQKKLVPPIIKIKNISGFTTLPTGEICLIINPYELIRYTISNSQVPSSLMKQLM